MCTASRQARAATLSRAGTRPPSALARICRRPGTWMFPTRALAAPVNTTCSTTAASSRRASSSRSEGAAMKTIRVAAAGLLFAHLAWGAVSPQEAARLGADLTPLGGEKAGNADGSIPAWSGGLKSAADAGFPNYHPGDHSPDPYASDKPLFTITPTNMAQYGGKLNEGH